MKKRKIFYFLKNKEEYDYMLQNNLIPKRGIVLIESTQEIYRNRIPYSGYSPLKQYFESIKEQCKEYTDQKNTEVKALIKQLKTSINEVSSNNDISRFKTKLQNLENKISNLDLQILNISSNLEIINQSLNNLQSKINYNQDSLIHLT